MIRGRRGRWKGQKEKRDVKEEGRRDKRSGRTLRGAEDGKSAGEINSRIMENEEGRKNT